MILKMYNNNNDKNVLDKTLLNETIFNVKIKGEIDIINPKILMNIKGDFTYNYIHIPELNRYYFIESIQVYPNNIWELRLQCDVLMTYKEFIIGSTALITKKVGNSYIKSGESLVKKDVDVYYSDVELDLKTGNTVLVTIGG